MNPFPHRLAANAEAVATRLKSILSDNVLDGELARPEKLLAAMRHGVLNGGKRIRPHLVIETAALFGVAKDTALQTACALECLHCYSLIHDDLPAMDNDDLRRGQPTVHRAFDEATAILAGDALLTLAFDLVTSPNNHDNPAIRAQLASMLARASGAGGMIGGQMLDIAAETQTPDEAGIRLLQSMKTGALIRFAVEAGAVIGEAEIQERKALSKYSDCIGLAFQLADDLLDETASAADMGKATQKDAQQGKGTLVGIHGQETAREMLAQLIKEANASLAPFGARADMLRDTANYIAERKH